MKFLQSYCKALDFTPLASYNSRRCKVLWLYKQLPQRLLGGA